MKPFIRHIFAILLALCCAEMASAGGSATFYSKVTASATGNGKVYVGTSQTNSPDYQSTSEATYSKEVSNPVSTPTSGTHTYHLYAQAEEGSGQMFLGWQRNGDIVSEDTHYQISVTATSTNSSSPTTQSYVAVFGDKPKVTVKTNNDALGSATIDKAANALGDKVTITAKRAFWSGGEQGTKYSKSHVFEGWYDENGTLFSPEEKVEFTIDKALNLEARFAWKPFFHGNGYYRVRWWYYQEYITVFGQYNPGFSALRPSLADRMLIGDLQFTADHTNPANVLRLEGTSFNLPSPWKAETQVMQNVTLYGQDVNTNSVMGLKLSIKTARNIGFFKCTYSLGCVAAWSHGNQMTEGGKTMFVTSDKPNDATNDPNSYFEIEPVDEAHIDEFWFGAGASKDLVYDDGYWTSMYASFPYQCYEPDGVEAYIISELQDVNGTNIAVLRKIENGIVPANTAVLLKCPEYIDDPVNGAPKNRLIPLMPDDENIDKTVADGNLLKGVFQLNTAKPSDSNPTPGHVSYNDETMRVLSVNGNGEIGFYRLESNADGSAKKLAANKAYLDISSLSPEQQAKGIRLITADNLAAIESIDRDVMEEAICGDGRIYDMYGRRVETMHPGQLYIVNGKVILHR